MVYANIFMWICVWEIIANTSSNFMPFNRRILLSYCRIVYCCILLFVANYYHIVSSVLWRLQYNVYVCALPSNWTNKYHHLHLCRSPAMGLLQLLMSLNSLTKSSFTWNKHSLIWVKLGQAYIYKKGSP